MTDTIKFSRRNVMRAGAMGGAALLGGAGTNLVASFKAKGADAPIHVISSASTQTLTIFNLLDSQGYLKEFDVTIDALHTADATTVMPALIGGEADICTIDGFGLVIATISKGAPLKILGSVCLLPQYAVYSAKPDVKSVKDLEGKIVGTGAIGALTYQLMVALMKKEGVDVSKVQFRNVGSNTDIFRAVAAGTVDAGPSGIDVYDQQAKFGVHSLQGGNFWTALPEYTFQGAYASNQAIANKRDGLVRVLAAFNKTYRFMQTPGAKDAFTAAYVAAAGKKNTAGAQSTWDFIQKYKPYSTDMALSEARVSYLQNLNMEFQLQKVIVPYSKVVDMSLAQDAMKLVGS